MAKTAAAKQYARHHSTFERMEPSEIAIKIVAYVLVTIFALMCLYPFIFTISGAISGIEYVTTGQIYLFPKGVQWDAIQYVLTDAKFWNSYTNTLFVTFYGTIYMMFIAICGGYALAKTRLFGHKVFNFLVVFTMWFSAGMVPVWINYQKTLNIMNSFLGIHDSKWLIVLAMGFAAFNIILMRNAFQSVPSEIEEAARVDGANDFQIMSKVFVPMSKATVATVALFFGISRWNGYFWARMMAWTDDIPLQVYIRDQLETLSDTDKTDPANWASQHNFATTSVIYSMIVCAIIPVLIIYPFIQKYFAAGVNLGGVKE
jgi:putative aldouronate transport system permease protein